MHTQRIFYFCYRRSVASYLLLSVEKSGERTERGCIMDRFEFFEQLDWEAGEILRKAKSEYACEADDLANFKLVAELMGIPPQQVLGVYLSKHFVAILKGVSLR